jgi:hypothetical protein
VTNGRISSSRLSPVPLTRSSSPTERSGCPDQLVSLMSILAYVVLFGWIRFSVVLYAILQRRKAAVISVIGAWLMLPAYGIDIGKRKGDIQDKKGASIILMQLNTT